MEDVLDVYQRPFEPDYPVICLDEKPVQLLSDIRAPLPVRPGHTAKQDSEYARGGTASLFVLVEPLGNWRRVSTRRRRTREDWAEEVQRLVDEDYPNAKKIVLVMDNLNTHTTASLYKRFPPAEARRLARKLEIHYTPKHGSWLNMAECEISVMARQALGERMGSMEQFQRATTVWAKERNEKQAGIDWRFTVDDARIKLRKLYPSYLMQ